MKSNNHISVENDKSWIKTFAFIWSGQLFSTLSSQVVTFSVIFWLSIKTGSAGVLALGTLSSMLPNLILGFFTGVLVDRWDRKRTMIVADLYVAAVTLVIIVLIWAGDVHIGYLYAMLALRSVGSAFHVPAMEASVPLLAPKDKLMRVAGVDNMIFSVSTIASPALAALFISLFDISRVLWFDIIGALIACTSLLFVHIPNPWDAPGEADASGELAPDRTGVLAPDRTGVLAPDRIDKLAPDLGAAQNLSAQPAEKFAQTDKKSAQTDKKSARLSYREELQLFFKQLKEGVHEVVIRPGLLWMFIFTIFASIAMVPISTLFPLMTLNHFAGNTYMMSVVEISWGVGMLVGGGLMSLSWFKFNNIKLINLMYIIIGFTYAASGFLPAPRFDMFVVLTALGGIAGAIFFGAFTVLLQTTLHSAVLGRVFSIHNSFIMIPAMISLMATGFIADAVGLENTFRISGLILILIGTLSPLLPAIRTFTHQQQ
jgi:MFS family permease